MTGGLWIATGAAAAAAAGGYAAGARRTAAAGRAMAQTLEGTVRRLLQRAGTLGFPAAGTGAASSLSAQVARFGFWVADRIGRSDEERRRLGAVLGAMTEGIVLLDRYGRVLLANGVAESLWPDMAPRLRGVRQIELFQDARLDRALTEAMRAGIPQQVEIERPGPAFDSPTRVWRVRILPLQPHEEPSTEIAGVTPTEAPAGAVVVVEDATERRALDRMRRDFVANVSHELQTPLTSIRGFAETLHEGGLQPDEERRFAARVLEQAGRMEALVRDLLFLARLEAPRWAPAEALSPAELMSEVVRDQGPGAGAAGLSLSFAASPESLQATMRGRPDELRLALSNLLRNAIAYTPPGGRVEVAASRLPPAPDAPEGAVRIEVSDTGHGIPAEALPRIFERFYRVDAGRSRETGGTGLGLSIAKHAVEGHGGTISVHSSVGSGSTFTVTLPLHGPPAP